MNDMLQRAGLRAWRVGGFSRVIRPKTVLYSLSLTVLAIALLLFGVMQGSLPVPASAIGRAVFDPQALTAQQQYVVWDVRLPRLLMALLCGAMLGLAGAAMQSITRNGLADLGSSVSKKGVAWWYWPWCCFSRQQVWFGGPGGNGRRRTGRHTGDAAGP